MEGRGVPSFPLRTDVDGVRSLMEGGGVPCFPTRSGGPRGDMSVLLASFARKGLAWGDGAGVIGGMSGGGQLICSY